jgi:RNA polymerase sigma factor (sigma-70 family)
MARDFSSKIYSGRAGLKNLLDTYPPKGVLVGCYSVCIWASRLFEEAYPELINDKYIGSFVDLFRQALINVLEQIDAYLVTGEQSIDISDILLLESLVAAFLAYPPNSEYNFKPLVNLLLYIYKIIDSYAEGIRGQPPIELRRTGDIAVLISDILNDTYIREQDGYGQWIYIFENTYKQLRENKTVGQLPLIGKQDYLNIYNTICSEAKAEMELTEEQFDFLKRQAYFVTRNWSNLSQDDINDVVEDAILKFRSACFRGMADPSVGPLDKYFRSFVWNVLNNKYRDNKAKKRSGLTQIPIEIFEQTYPVYERSSEYEQEETVAWLFGIARSMDKTLKIGGPYYSDIFAGMLEGLTIRQIAGRLGTSPSTVQNRIVEIQEHLRRTGIPGFKDYFGTVGQTQVNVEARTAAGTDLSFFFNDPHAKLSDQGYAYRDTEGFEKDGYHGRKVIWYSEVGEDLVGIDADMIVATDQNIFSHSKLNAFANYIRKAEDKVVLPAPKGEVYKVRLYTVKEVLQYSEYVGHEWTTGEKDADEFLKDPDQFVEDNFEEYADEAGAQDPSIDELEAMSNDERGAYEEATKKAVREYMEKWCQELEEKKSGDLGSIYAVLADGNHRAFAAKEAGEHTIWIFPTSYSDPEALREAKDWGYMGKEKKTTSGSLSSVKVVDKIKILVPEIVSKANIEVQMEFEHRQTSREEDVDVGGICDYIADIIAEILDANDIETRTVHNDSTNHTYVEAQSEKDTIIQVDIPYCLYEVQKSFYNYEILDTTIKDKDVTIWDTEIPFGQL